jgi:hypothetical protein
VFHCNLPNVVLFGLSFFAKSCTYVFQDRAIFLKFCRLYKCPHSTGSAGIRGAKASLLPRKGSSVVSEYARGRLIAFIKFSNVVITQTQLRPIRRSMAAHLGVAKEPRTPGFPILPAERSAALVLGRCRRRIRLFDEGQHRNAAAHEIRYLLPKKVSLPGSSMPPRKRSSNATRRSRCTRAM